MSSFMMSTSSLMNWAKPNPGFVPVSYPAGQVLVRPNKDNSNEWGISYAPSRLVGSDSLVSSLHYRPRIRFDRKSGGNAGKAYQGITRDTDGVALASATVQLFRTSTGEKLAEGVSSAIGEYLLVTPYNDAHFVATWKTGSPTVAGITDPTITGS